MREELTTTFPFLYFPAIVAVLIALLWYGRNPLIAFHLAACGLFLAYLLAYVSTPLKEKLLEPFNFLKESRKIKKMLNSSIFSACCGLFCAAGGVVFEVLRTGKGLQVVAFAFQIVVVLCLANSFCNLGMVVWMWHKK